MAASTSFCADNQLILVTALISILISDDLSADQLSVLGAFLTSIGDLLALKAAQLSAAPQKNVKQQIQALEDQIKKLKDSIG